MGDGDGRRPASPFERWRPPSLTAPFRGGREEPPLERWEAVLRAERSVRHRLRTLISGVPRLGRLVGVTEQNHGVKLEDRERRVSGPAHRLTRALTRTPEGRPRPGPLLDREIDAALALLADVPFEEIQERGWSLQPNNFVWPLNDVPFLRRNPELWARARMPRGIYWDVDGQVELIRRLSRYGKELDDVPDRPEQRPGEFVWDNGSFSAADAYAYYGLVRDLRPKRVVEVGVGMSSLLLARALRANGTETEVSLIDPGPRWDWLGELPPGWDLQQTIVQKASMSTFEALEAGDVLFYDGSHCAEAGGDVNWMLFRVLPVLARGVWIHFHDIAWPHDYSADWVLNEGLSWNEQYVLQAFLMHNSAYRVRLAMAMLATTRGEELTELFGERAFGGSVWIQKDPGWARRQAAAGSA